MDIVKLNNMKFTGFQIICMMFAAGVLGGIVNYGLSRTNKSTLKDLGWSIAIGLGASFLVPLFLNTISSSLLSGLLDGSAEISDPFVFFGFCLLGAIASKAMIQTLTQKVLRTAQEAKNEVQSLKSEVAPVLIKETEPEEELEQGGVKVEGYGLVGTEPPSIIKALGNSKYSRRTVSGIQKESGVPKEKVIEVLQWLQSNGLGFTTGQPKHYWSLTEKGRRVFQDIIGK
jgi:predicted transcriptional regulator